MARENWQDREDERRRRALRDTGRDDFGQADYAGDYGYDPQARAGYRVEDEIRPGRDDFGQADYSTDYAYDPERRGAYRRYAEADRDYARRMESGDYRASQPRSWMDGARAFFSPGPRAPHLDARPAAARRGPSDRVLWAVIVERLEDERGLDLRDVEVIVEDAEVTLNGTVRHKADKRRIEDVAEIDGVRHVQNNLRHRGHGHWTFL
ncbi:BON domain-containing protein [Phenylobacterium sp.]|uniref:BON domain-containing protein n=1 Tax=Phenylobacterium sp. TaxID=1871053 RepID=UPI002D126F09|nr:BON domain-containing protein [Phenylobacterium sp.]HLZ73823.1 BON domain-containing protein [Phenylobacterium sp.]